MMDLVWVTPGTPYPPDQGERVVTFNRIKRLADRGHRIHVLSIVDEPVELEYSKELSNYCASATYFERRRGLRTALAAPLTPYPVESRFSPALYDRLVELVEERPVDVVVAEHTNVTKYLRGLDVPTCFSVHNLVYRSLAWTARTQVPSPTAVPYAAEAARMYTYERRLYEGDWFDDYAFLSESERDEVVRRFPHIADRTWVSPVGVDVKRFVDPGPLPDVYATEAPTAVFTATMNYSHNVEAATWFVKEVFPRIRARIPDARIILVGKNPSNRVRALDIHQGVAVTGHVEAVEPFIGAADVVVIPLLTGVGVKIKLLEAMGSGSAIVTTSVGADGVPVEDGEHLLVADDAETFARRVGDVLANPAEYEKLRESAYVFARDQYDWPAVVDGLEKRLKSLATS